MGIVKKLVFYSKCVTAVTVFFSCAFYGVLASILFSLVGKRHLAQWVTARAFYNVFKIFLGINIKIINEERLYSHSGVIISNHQSDLDLLVLGKLFPPGCTVVAKESLKWVPIIGWFMSLSGTFFLNRSNKEKSVCALNAALGNLRKNKRTVWIFPEGTRSYLEDIGILSFKKGAFHLAQQGQLPIIPVVVTNTSNIYNPRKGVFNKGTITCKVLEPIKTTNIKTENVGLLTEQVHSIFQDECKKLGYSKVLNDSNSHKNAD